jgi:hypothetical protein
MHKRTRRTLLVVAGVVLLLAVAVFLRSKAPPEAARLLPESEGIIYFNLKPVRAFMHKDMKPPSRDPDYQEFVDATGVDWEQDLDSAALALHRMPDPNGPNGPVAYSMVLTGRLTGKRLNAWLEAHATSREVYEGHTIYNVSSQGRTVRITQVGYDMLAVSNTPTGEQIHSILDQHRTAALPFAGSTLLSQHFHDVPLLAVAWGIGQIGLPFSESGSIKVLGLSLPLEADSTIIASVTPGLPLGSSVRLRVEEIAPDEQKATSQAASLATLVTLARGVTTQLEDDPANNALRELLKTAEITQKRNRVIGTASLNSSFFSQLTGSANSFKEPATPNSKGASK